MTVVESKTDRMPRKADASQYLRRLTVMRASAGRSQIEVARAMGVSVRSVQRWLDAWKAQGDAGLVGGRPSGRPPRLSEQQAAQVLSWLETEASSFGFVTDRWTATRLGVLIERTFGLRFNHRYLNRWVARRRVTPQIPAPVPRERDPEAIKQWLTMDWPAMEKKAAAAGAGLVFTDESGLLMAPLVRASLAPAGHTPTAHPPARHRQKVSVAAALVRSPIAHRAMLIHQTFADGYVDDFFYAAFLREQVLARLRGPIVLLQDRGTMHRGDCTQDVIEDFSARLQVHEFPAYAPELNPVEQLWNWTKDKQLGNYHYSATRVSVKSPFATRARLGFELGDTG